jgi:hypothetical protein
VAPAWQDPSTPALLSMPCLLASIPVPRDWPHFLR